MSELVRRRDRGEHPSGILMTCGISFILFLVVLPALMSGCGAEIYIEGRQGSEKSSSKRQYIEGRITSITKKNNEGQVFRKETSFVGLILIVEEPAKAKIHTLVVKETILRGESFLTAEELYEILKVGDIVRIPDRGDLPLFPSDIEILTEFTKEGETADVASSAIEPDALPEYEVVTESGKVFALSLKNKQVKIYGDAKEIRAHIDKFDLELRIVREYIQEESVEKRTLLRRLKNAGFIKVVEYRSRTVGDLIGRKDFLVLESE